MIKRFLLLMPLISLSLPVYSLDSTGKGKITAMKSHTNPTCISVTHSGNNGGPVNTYLIADNVSSNSIQAVALTAKITNSDATIFYDSSVFSTCVPTNHLITSISVN